MNNVIWTEQFENEIDFQFITRVQKEVTQSCALPFAVPVDRIPEFIIQADDSTHQLDMHITVTPLVVVDLATAVEAEAVEVAGGGH